VPTEEFGYIHIAARAPNGRLVCPEKVMPKGSPRSAEIGTCFFLLALTLHWLVFQATETVPGVTSRPFGPCGVDWFSERPALVLACLRNDMIRLWPLPVEHLWFEEDWSSVNLAQAGTVAGL
jgi:hypothetical protein